MKQMAFLCLAGLVPLWAGELPEKAAGYHEALMKRPESAALFQRFRDAWLEERNAGELEKELLSRAEAGNAGDWAVLARARAVSGNHTGALQAYQKARTFKPEAWIDLEIARLQLAARDFAAAETSALSVPAADKLYCEALKLAGLACLRGDKVEQALDCWNRAVEAAPGDKGLLEELTELTRREGRVDLALDYSAKWRDLLDDAYGKAMATLRRSELLLARQRFEESLEELSAVLRVAGDGSWLEREVISRVEQAFRQRGGTLEWAKWIGERAEENPARLGFRRAHARALAAAGKPEDALTVLAEVTKRSPGDLSVRWERVAMLEQAYKLKEAFAECAELAEAEKSEAAGLRLAELAFRLRRMDEVKRVLDGVLAAADPAKRISLTGLYAKYGLPEEAERLWRDAAARGDSAGTALRELARCLHARGRLQDAVEAWKQLGRLDAAADRIEAAQMLAASGERDEPRRILTESRDRFKDDPDVESAFAEFAMTDGKPGEALAIYQNLARAAKLPDALAQAQNGWLRAAKTANDPLRDLGDETADRCLRAAFLAESGGVLPAVREGDDLERDARLALLRKHGRWTELVGMMEAFPGGQSPLFLSELAEAKSSAGDLAGALQAARSWRERAMEQPSPWLREADVLEKLGKVDEAVMVLRRAMARFEDNEDIARALFDLLGGGSEPREALDLAWFRHDRTQDDSVRGDWRRRIMRLSEEKNRMEDLRQRLDERVRRDPASPWPLLALAELAKRLGDSREELGFLRRAVVNAPQDVSLLTSLAVFEERMGNASEALRLHTEIARLAPGPDSARQLACIRIRLGDIDGGLRDLQTLAVDDRIGPRDLEGPVAELVAWGCVEEAIRLLSSVDPTKRDARLHFALGCLLEADGRELDAIRAYAAVIAEPDDPAEQSPAFGYDGGDPRLTKGFLMMLASGRGQIRDAGGNLSDLRVPGSLREAKQSVRAKLLRFGLLLEGDVWKEVVSMVPELGVASLDQWREARSFANEAHKGSRAAWLEFIRKHPGNPLGFDLLLESSGVGNIGAAEVDALLNRTPPLSISQQLTLRTYGLARREDNLEFLNQIPAGEWKDRRMAALALALMQREFTHRALVLNDTAPFKPCLAELATADFQAPSAGILADLSAAVALLDGKPELFLERLNSLPLSVMPQWAQGRPDNSMLPQTFRIWSERAGAEERDAVIARIKSPVMRCRYSTHLEDDGRLALLESELLALPADAPAEERSGLWLMKLPVLQAAGNKDELRKLAADDTDPLLAFSALCALNRIDRENERSPEVQARLALLLGRVRFLAGGGNGPAALYGMQRGRLTSHQPPANRWGPETRLFNGNTSPGQDIQQVMGIEDKELAAREAAKLLIRLATWNESGSRSLSTKMAALGREGLLEPALETITCPAGSGLCRKLAVMRLMNAASKGDRGFAILSDIAVSRPWETNWSIDLALRTADGGQRKLLLDGMADRPGFDSLLIRGLMEMPFAGAESRVTVLNHLADWAETSGNHHAWVGDVLLMMARGETGLKRLVADDKLQLACYRRYLGLALNDRNLAEFGFRMKHALRHLEKPEGLADAARMALLSGAYSTASENPDLERLRGAAGNLKLELAALEHLVIIAGEENDEVAFPPDFREKLKNSDQETSAWLEKLLSARKVAELPDVADVKAMKSADWSMVARHEAAVLRAEKLPGRDAWLAGLFREKIDGDLSGNLSHVIRASLMDAAPSKTAGKRVIEWLEAVAGPSARWDEAGRGVLAPRVKLILGAVSQCEFPAVRQVLDAFRESKVCVSDPQRLFENLGVMAWRESRKPGSPGLEKLLGPETEDMFLLGYWQSTGKGIYWNWALPTALGAMVSEVGVRDIEAIGKKADPSFVELMLWRYCSVGITAEKKALIKAAPVLVKLPPVYRKAAVTSLTAEMSPADLKGLPDFLTAIMDEEAERKSSERMDRARRDFRSIRERGGELRAEEIARLLGPVLLDDPAFVDEVIAAWKPAAEKDRSGGRMAVFSARLIDSCGQDPRQAMAAVRVIEEIHGGKLPPPKPGATDLIDTMVSRLEQRIRELSLWREVAVMPPSFQVRFWLSYLKKENSGYYDEAEDIEAFRAAVPEDSPSRAVLEWYLQERAWRRESKRKIESAKCLEVFRMFKREGVLPEDLIVTLGSLCGDGGRLDDCQAFLMSIPAELEGLKTFPPGSSGKLIQAMAGEWGRFRSEHRSKNPTAADDLPKPPEPEKWVALMKFIITRGGVDPARNEYYHREINSLILALGDEDLLDNWLKASGKSMAGDRRVILWLLEEGRIAEAVMLSPTSGSYLSEVTAFNSDTEKHVAKLRTDKSPAAFRLAVLLSNAHDALKDKVPTEKRAARLARLTKEYNGMRAGLSLDDRVSICMALPFATAAIRGNVPELDEFPLQDVWKDFRQSVAGGKSASLGGLFIPILCSRLHAGDTAALDLYTGLIAGSWRNVRSLEYHSRTLAACLCALANAGGGFPDEAVSTGFLAYGKALAKVEHFGMMREIASLLIHMASKDAAARAAALKDCGLEGVKPAVSDSESGMMMDREFGESLLKLAIFRQDLREVLLTALRDSTFRFPGMFEMPMIMGDAAVRANIPPDLFLEWNRDTLRMPAALLANVEAYAKERRADFNELQMAEMDALIDRWKHPERPVDPEVRKQIDARRNEEMRRRMDEMNKRRMERMRKMIER